MYQYKGRKYGGGEKREFFRKHSPIGSSLDLLKEVHKVRPVKSADDAHQLVLDPTGRAAHYWSGIVSVAVVYYMWSSTYRWAFSSDDPSKGLSQQLWLCLDTFCYALYFADVLAQIRTSFLKDGILQTDLEVLYHHYIGTPSFWLDVLAILPFDVAYMVLYRCPAPPLFHAPKFLKYYRLRQFSDRTETRTHMPNFCRTAFVVHNLLVMIHWNACLYFLISKHIGFGSDRWVYPAWNTTESSEWGTVSRQYIYSFYWSALTLTTIGELPEPQSNGEYLFVTVDFLVGVLMFASLVGNIGAIIENMQKTRMKFQSKMDSIKSYMNVTRVPSYLQERVIKWFDYLWSHGHTISDDQQVLSALPDKLKAEIGMHVHFETLKKVEFFQECEGGLLWELVLRLRTQVYSPGEYVCRKGDVGREMYIVNRGRLEVLADENKAALKELVPGEYFGEISILNLGQSQHRRTAFVRSVGYSDLLCLTQADLMDVLQDYPQTLQKLKVRGTSILRKDSDATAAKDNEGEAPSTPPLYEGKEEAQEAQDPPLQLLSLADQVVTMHSRIAKLEDTLGQLLVEVRKSRTESTAEQPKPNRNMSSITAPIVKVSRKLSSIF